MYCTPACANCVSTVGDGTLAEADKSIPLRRANGMTWPILLTNDSANHNAPSGPVVMPYGWLEAVGMGYSFVSPEVVIRPISLLFQSVNHKAPSGPAVMLYKFNPALGTGYSQKQGVLAVQAAGFGTGVGHVGTGPDVLMRPILLP